MMVRQAILCSIAWAGSALPAFSSQHSPTLITDEGVRSTQRVWDLLRPSSECRPVCGQAEGSDGELEDLRLQCAKLERPLAAWKLGWLVTASGVGLSEFMESSYGVTSFYFSVPSSRLVLAALILLIE